MLYLRRATCTSLLRAVRAIVPYTHQRRRAAGAPPYVRCTRTSLRRAVRTAYRGTPGAEVLFWSFLATAYFVLLNLLIAIFNSAYDRIISNSIPEWLFIRLNTLLEFESDIAQPGVRAYYKQLQTRDGQRAMGYKRDDD